MILNKQMRKIVGFCKKPMLTKSAIILSSLAVGITLYSLSPAWADQRPMPEVLKKKLR